MDIVVTVCGLSNNSWATKNGSKFCRWIPLERHFYKRIIYTIFRDFFLEFPVQNRFIFDYLFSLSQLHKLRDSRAVE
jgi:hypothetical protein